MFQRVNGFDRERKIRYGTPGAWDLWGFRRKRGYYDMEVKTGSGELTDGQQAWGEILAEFDIPRYVCWTQDAAGIPAAVADAEMWLLA